MEKTAQNTTLHLLFYNYVVAFNTNTTNTTNRQDYEYTTSLT